MYDTKKASIQDLDHIVENIVVLSNIILPYDSAIMMLNCIIDHITVSGLYLGQEVKVYFLSMREPATRYALIMIKINVCACTSVGSNAGVGKDILHIKEVLCRWNPGFKNIYLAAG